jgi:hypothetical protein
MLNTEQIQDAYDSSFGHSHLAGLIAVANLARNDALADAAADATSGTVPVEAPPQGAPAATFV